MRILHVTKQFTDISHGGVESHVENLATAMAELGHTVTVARISSDASDGAENGTFQFLHVPILGGAQSHAGGSSRGLLRELQRRVADNSRAVNLPEFEALIRAHDIVHFHDFLAIARLARHVVSVRPTFWTNHLGEFLFLRKSPLGKVALRQLTKPFCGASAPSAELADQTCISAPVTNIPNGVDFEYFSPPAGLTRAEAKAHLGLGEGPLMLVPRRWAPTKGVHLVSSALSAYADAGIRVAFVGGGNSGYESYRSRVQAEIDAATADAIVIPYLQSSELRRWMWAADVTAIPSVMEATSLAAMEAMAAGSIVVSTRVGGATEIIEDGISGLLTEVTAESFLASVLRCFAMDDTAQQAMRTSASAFSASRSWVRIAGDVIALYGSAIGAHQATFRGEAEHA